MRSTTAKKRRPGGEMNRKWAHRLACAVGVLCALAGLGIAAKGTGSAADETAPSAQGAEAAMVIVESSLSSPAGPGRGVRATNTGFFVGSEGEVIASLYAVAGCSTIQVRCADGRVSPARLHAFHQPTGLALLKTDLRDTASLRLKTEAPVVGEPIAAMSCDRSAEGEIEVSVSRGSLSSCDACVKLCGVRWEGLLQGDVRAGPGGAAGPVLDGEGMLLGVVLGAEAGDGEGVSCSYVLPAEGLGLILAGLLEGKTQRVGWLGVAVTYSAGMEGLTVQGVLEGSPAYAAGLRPGDVLLAVDGQSIGEPAVFESAMSGLEPGSEMRLGLLRGNEMKTITARAGARPLMVSRIPVRVPYNTRGSPPKIVPVMLDARTHAVYRQMIDGLRKENSDLRERVLQLEQRLQRVEQRRGGESD